MENLMFDFENEEEEKVIETPDVMCESALKMYLREMGSFNLLSAEEEHDLAVRAAKGDSEAKKRLVEANLRLVISVAKRYNGCGMTMLDLIQEGNIGLMKAADKFDYEKGFRFSTYATWWIKQSISRAVADQSRTIRVPVHIAEMINRIRKTERELTSQLGHEPTVEDLAKALNLKEEEVKEMQSYMSDTSSLDVQVGDEEDTTIGSLIADNHAMNPEDSYINNSLHDMIIEIVDTLSEREAEIIKLRFGLNNGKPMTLEEVGQAYGLTRERIRQIEAKALRKLRHPARSNMLKECMA
jgi:RNA polymerase primary sigma factor